jgi:hypothetical protein
MTLLTQSQLAQLLANGKAQRAAIDNDQGAIDFMPVVKLFSILCLAGPFGLSMPSPGDGESEARLHLASRPPAVATSMWQNAQCTWLLTELDPEHELAFGLCDLGMGLPRLKRHPRFEPPQAGP